MLRQIIIVVLIVLNLFWWSWTQGWLAPLGLPATPTGEPERLTRQLHPEALQVQPLPPGSTTAKAVSGADAASDADEPQAASSATRAQQRSRH